MSGCCRGQFSFNNPWFQSKSLNLFFGIIFWVRFKILSRIVETERKQRNEILWNQLIFLIMVYHVEKMSKNSIQFILTTVTTGCDWLQLDGIRTRVVRFQILLLTTQPTKIDYWTKVLTLSTILLVWTLAITKFWALRRRAQSNTVYVPSCPSLCK